MDMGYGSFRNLRVVIARLLNEEFGNNYNNIIYCHTPKDIERNDKKAEEFIRKYRLDEDIVNFLYMTDCEGKIDYKTCRKIYDLVKDYDDDKMYGYVQANNSFKYFKQMLLDCATKRRMLFWS